MRKINNAELKEIVELHQKWLKNEKDGQKADLRWANLSGADLSGADLRWADLSRADLSDANLIRADLSGADLSGADLSGADLIRADLSRADLSGADLRWADLRWANLSRADLSDANLSRADLRWANFPEIKGFECVCFIISTSCRNRLVNYIPSLDIVTAGCFQGTFQEFKDKVEKTHKDNEFVLQRCERIIAFLEQEKKFNDERALKEIRK